MDLRTFGICLGAAELAGRVRVRGSKAGRLTADSWEKAAASVLPEVLAAA